MTKWLYAFTAKNCFVSRRPQKTAIDSEYNRSFKQTADMYGTLTSIQVCIYTPYAVVRCLLTVIAQAFQADLAKSIEIAETVDFLWSNY